ncbi:LOW QUALITY PROTEIN: muramoyltetrapeptide carboxypeptidase [Geomicrobium sp. JCM 19055]|nr:LOW QUALITY PROTEIN: muramoyltetrapeptide carboxypeptidase [Geomicrobium sp. JCM 19055]
MVVRPASLQANDTVGIVSLGSPLDPNIINERILYLESLGFNVLVGESVFRYTGFLSGSDEERANDFMRMIVNEQVKWILPVRGGVGVAGILRYLDWDLIRQNPKIVTGYSDITVLLNALYQFADLETLHSLMLIDFKLSTPAFNFNQLFRAISNTQVPTQLKTPRRMLRYSIVPGVAEGEIVGGNLTSIIGTLATPYEIDTTGKLFFIEEVNEPVHRVYRQLLHLEEAGKFDDCAGVLIGRCTNCQTSYGVNYEQLLEEFFSSIGKPTLANIASGHGQYKTTIPIGAEAIMDSENDVIETINPVVI